MQLLRAQVAEAGEVIVRAASRAHSMYFIAAGEVEIAPAARSGCASAIGQFFGEVAVLRRARRSATATALTRTNLLVLDAHDLHALMQRDPRIAAAHQGRGRKARRPQVVQRDGRVAARRSSSARQR